MQNSYRTNLSLLILKCFENKLSILSYSDIKKYFTDLNLKPHKSTIYRQLEIYTNQGYLNQIKISGLSYWEIKNKNNSYVECKNCEKIKSIALDQSYLLNLNIIPNFEIQEILFKGTCTDCKEIN
jgi:Fe2+ or Zn2+ uptake regulation protein